MQKNITDLNKDTIETYFGLLNEKLKMKKQNAEILICGGASMAMLYDNSIVTRDIDGMILSTELKQDVTRYIYEISEENNLRLDWFNEGAKGYINLNWERDLVLDYSNLKVFSVSAEKLLVMKLSAARYDGRDLQDAAKLMKFLDIESVDYAVELLEHNLPNYLLTPKMEYFAMDAMALKKQMIQEEMMEIRFEKNTLVVNAFGGPGAGKTTAAWDIAAQLKKQGYCVEYVSEYAKELVWEEQFDLLDGSPTNQEALFNEQKRRIDRLIGKVDMVITDSPLLLNLMYCKQLDNDYEEYVLSEYKKYDNFNFIVNRGTSFEKEGRIHNLEESKQKDKEIRTFLNDKELYYGIYAHETIDTLIRNISVHYDNLQHSNKGKERGINNMTEGKREKVYLRVNKAFVKTGLQAKDSDRTYNRVTIPSNTVVDGRNVGGFSFFPLYVNDDIKNENMVNIPLIKDSFIQLNKDGEKLQVEPQKLQDALKESYAKWSKSRELDAIADENHEFEWQGQSFRSFIKEYISTGLDELEAEKIKAGELTNKITEYDRKQGLLFAGGAYEAREFIREHFYEAVETQEKLVEKMGVVAIDPLLSPESFAFQMVELGVDEMLDEIELFKEKDKIIEFNQQNIKQIRKSLGISNDRSLGRELDKEHDLELE